MARILQVALPVPLRQPFDYLPPKDVDADALQPGIRIAVPFGPQHKVSYLLEVKEKSLLKPEKLKRATKILDSESLLSTIDFDLLLWASRYYHHPIGEVIASAFPVLLRSGKPAQTNGPKRYKLTKLGDHTAADTLQRAPRQKQLFLLIQSSGHGIADDHLRTLDWDWRNSARQLQQKGLIAITTTPSKHSTSRDRPSPFRLNSAQQHAVNTVKATLGRFTVTLLEGVTGSGKTEVYMRLMQAVLQAGQQVMVLLPEITLTPQLEARFRERFSVPIAVFHSSLGEAERRNAWLNFRSGAAPILLGTRSAVFTPMRNPGLIILDEEHDISFKQQEGFRFSARDIAISRGQRLAVPVLLGSATPSLESLVNIQRRRYQHLSLPERAGNASKPTFHVISILNSRLNEGFSVELIGAIGETLARGEQALIFLNRRGFAPTLICHRCGWVARCPQCDANLVVHFDERRLRCHHCAFEQVTPRTCKNCDTGDIRPLGLGTERIEKALREQFPQHRIARIDRDSTRRKGSLQTFLAEIHSGAIDILLGTQMLAKGHDFPNVTLVGILDVDAGLFSTDFRASERMAQLIVQVAGRAGRAKRPGRVLLQTRHPQHPLLMSLLEGGYQAFSNSALDERQTAGLPPYSFQALFRAEAKTKEHANDFLRHAGKLANRDNPSQVEVLGPVSAPLTRRAGYFRSQLLLQSGSRSALHGVLGGVLAGLAKARKENRIRWSVDVDPVDLY